MIPKEVAFIAFFFLYLFFSDLFFDLSLLSSSFLFFIPLISSLVWNHFSSCWFDKNDPRSRTYNLRNTSPPPPGGKVVSLTRGDCHYRYDGVDNEGRLVVLVHGFVGCHLDYQFLADHLVKTGKRRVLRLDNYGRGWSTLSHNHISPSPELYAGQLSDLLFYLGENEKIDLVGYSMGGPIASFFTSSFPSSIHSLTLIAPAGLPVMRKKPISPLHQLFFSVLSGLPVVGMPISCYLAKNFLKSSFLERKNTGWQRGYNGTIQDYFHSYCATRLQNEPALPLAAVETLKSFPWGEMTPIFQRIREENIPVHALWADKDGTIPFESIEELSTLFIGGNFKSKVFENIGHMMVLEGWEEVGEEMISFFNSLG